MPVYIASLNSGSNGNCYYIGNEYEAVLIDAGLSCRETEKRMRRLGLSFQKVKAIFISHEHSDHIKGVTLISRKYQLPVYITARTAKNGRLYIEDHLTRSFRPHEDISLGSIQVRCFPKRHDAIEPHSFTVTTCNKTVGIFTDIGAICDNVTRYFGQCHAAFLEANYDAAMLEGGRYPYHLKRRISGGWGHLSNMEALELFLAYRSQEMSHLFLAHLSKDNNDPELVQALFSDHARGAEIVVASRYNESNIYCLEDAGAVKPQQVHRAQQIALF